jgi:hypothetical protein
MRGRSLESRLRRTRADVSVVDVPDETRHRRTPAPGSAPHDPRLPPEVPPPPGCPMYCRTCSEATTFTRRCVGETPAKPRTVVAGLYVCEECGHKVELRCDVCNAPYQRPPSAFGGYNPRD